jgi:hypothetical protein
VGHMRPALPVSLPNSVYLLERIRSTDFQHSVILIGTFKNIFYMLLSYMHFLKCNKIILLCIFYDG